MSLRAANDDTGKADRASGLLAVVGVVNVPIIHYSVEWWNSLHQGATIIKLGEPAITGDMLWPLLTMMVGFGCYFATVLMIRARSQVLQRERNSRWLKDL